MVASREQSRAPLQRTRSESTRDWPQPVPTSSASAPPVPGPPGPPTRRSTLTPLPPCEALLADPSASSQVVGHRNRWRAPLRLNVRSYLPLPPPPQTHTHAHGSAASTRPRWRHRGEKGFPPRSRLRPHALPTCQTRCRVTDEGAQSRGGHARASPRPLDAAVGVHGPMACGPGEASPPTAAPAVTELSRTCVGSPAQSPAHFPPAHYRTAALARGPANRPRAAGPPRRRRRRRDAGGCACTRTHDRLGPSLAPPPRLGGPTGAPPCPVGRRRRRGAA